MKTDGRNSAFPCFDGAGIDFGITKREYFAGLAMQGILASVQSVELRQIGKDRSWNVPNVVAKTAVDYADALIDALNEDTDG